MFSHSDSQHAQLRRTVDRIRPAGNLRGAVGCRRAGSALRCRSRPALYQPYGPCTAGGRLLLRVLLGNADTDLLPCVDTLDVVAAPARTFVERDAVRVRRDAGRGRRASGPDVDELLTRPWNGAYPPSRGTTMTGRVRSSVGRMSNVFSM